MTFLSSNLRRLPCLQVRDNKPDAEVRHPNIDESIAKVRTSKQYQGLDIEIGGSEAAWVQASMVRGIGDTWAVFCTEPALSCNLATADIEAKFHEGVYREVIKVSARRTLLSSAEEEHKRALRRRRPSLRRRPSVVLEIARQ